LGDELAMFDVVSAEKMFNVPAAASLTSNEDGLAGQIPPDRVVA
jgi:hypothetical protein